MKAHLHLERHNQLSAATRSGTGLSSGSASLYADGSWAKTRATPANGANTYTATARNTANRTATDSVTVNLPSTASFSYDSNGNLTGDGLRTFEYDAENQLTAVQVAGVETIDATGTDTSLLGHSYFAETRSVLADIFKVIRNGQRASQRVGLRPMESPDGRYWVFKR